MGKMAVVGSSGTKDSQRLVLSGGTVDEVADKVALFMGERGYSLESGSKTQGVYGRGSAAARAIVGPLAKRLKFNVILGQDGGNVALVVAKGMSGMGGGLIGASQEQKEFQRILSELQSSLLA
jgi:hypothetical protein